MLTVVAAPPFTAPAAPAPGCEGKAFESQLHHILPPVSANTGRSLAHNMPSVTYPSPVASMVQESHRYCIDPYPAKGHLIAAFCQ